MNDLALFLWILFGFVGCLIGVFKNRRGLGLCLGLLLGPVGWIILLFLKDIPEGEMGSGVLIVTVIVLIIGGLYWMALTRDAQESAERQRKVEAERIREIQENRSTPAYEPIVAVNYQPRPIPLPAEPDQPVGLRYLPPPQVARRATPDPAQELRRIQAQYGVGKP